MLHLIWIHCFLFGTVRCICIILILFSFKTSLSEKCSRHLESSHFYIFILSLFKFTFIFWMWENKLILRLCLEFFSLKKAFQTWHQKDKSRIFHSWLWWWFLYYFGRKDDFSSYIYLKSNNFFIVVSTKWLEINIMLLLAQRERTQSRHTFRRVCLYPLCHLFI